MGHFSTTKKLTAVLFERMGKTSEGSPMVRIQWHIDTDTTVDELRIIRTGLSNLVQNIDAMLLKADQTLKGGPSPSASERPSDPSTYPSSVPVHREGYG